MDLKSPLSNFKKLLPKKGKKVPRLTFNGCCASDTMGIISPFTQNACHLWLLSLYCLVLNKLCGCQVNDSLERPVHYGDAENGAGKVTL